MSTPPPLESGTFYHIYNCGNNREAFFIETWNYAPFLGLYQKYCKPNAETYGYCLLPNHFHFLVRIREKTRPSTDSPLRVSARVRSCST
jgi:REP element-mobilizing transposase RayT